MAKLKRKMRLASREDGVVSVELVILFPVIALIVLAILEFGHLWYVRHTLTIASREGARAAVVYYVTGDREAWAKQEAKDKVNDFLQNTAKWDTGDWTVPEPVVVPNPATGGLVGGTLTVRAQTENSLLVLHKLTAGISVAAETTMRFE